MKKISIRKTGGLFLVIAVISGLLAVGITYTSINAITKKVPMLVAERRIVAGDPLKESDFKVVDVPISGRPGDAVLPGESLDGLVAFKDMSEKDILRRANTVDFEEVSLPVLSTRLRAVEESLEGTSEIEDSTLRAGEIPIDSIVGMLDGMKEGDKIAVTSVYVEELAEGPSIRKIRRTETIFDYIHILGIKPPADNFKGNVVIALSQRQFEALALAREKGKFYISLMPFGVVKPEGHPEILSDLYIEMLDKPESKNNRPDENLDINDFQIEESGGN